MKREYCRAEKWLRKSFQRSYWKQTNWSLCQKHLLKGHSKNNCFADLSDIENTLLKNQQNCQKIPTISAVEVFNLQLISPRVFSQDFFGTSVNVYYPFFPRLQCVKQEFILFFLFLQKITRPIPVSQKLELEICLIIPDVSIKFSPAFQNIEAAFEKC